MYGLSFGAESILAQEGFGGRGETDFCRKGRMHPAACPALGEGLQPGRRAVQALRLLPGLLRSSYSLAGTRHGPGSPETAPGYRTSCMSMGIAASPSRPVARGSPVALAVATAGEKHGGTKRRGRDPRQTWHFGAAAEEP